MGMMRALLRLDSNIIRLDGKVSTCCLVTLFVDHLLKLLEVVTEKRK